MESPSPPNPSSQPNRGAYRGNIGITLLRITLWLVPAIILPLSFFLARWLWGFWFIAGILMLGIFVAIGYFDMLLSYHQRRSVTSLDRKSIFGWAITFALIQLIIAPGIVLMIVVLISNAIKILKPGFSFVP